MKEVILTIINRVQFKHIVSLIMLLIAGLGAFAILLDPNDTFSAEIKGSVVTLILIGGFTTVANYWIGSADKNGIHSLPQALDNPFSTTPKE